MILLERNFHGRRLSFETGRVAKQAGGAVLVRYGDSIVLVTACGGAQKDYDFLPLTVDYVEKTYAAGKIPGGFFKREGKLSEKEILTSRLIDRPCRPLFPERYSREVQIIATVISADDENDTDVLAMCGASAALTISDLPFEGPIAAVRVGRVDGKLVINPTLSDLQDSDLNMVVAGSKDAIVMVEGGAQQLSEDVLLEALFFAHQELQPLLQMQEELQKKVGKPKEEYTVPVDDSPVVSEAIKFITPKLEEAIRIKEKLARRDAFSKTKEEMKALFVKEEDPEKEKTEKGLSRVFEDTLYKVAREVIFKDGVRIDGRDTKTVRQIDIELGLLPRTHGSSLFTRGETQAIVVATLGTEQEAQRIDNLLGENTKRFMLHYNFPPFSVGETKPLRGPGRREIGHGALAERAIKAVLPSEKEFPYVLRVVSEITESNGSSSMATVCGTSLALMDAGVPLKAPVAGIAMGLIKEGGKTAILTDILGDEDHLGDMDFKICGTSKGVTAVQMDIKIKGLDRDTVKKALDQAREARLHILGKMNDTITTHRETLSPFAPKIVSFKINPDKIRDLIGPGGKMIRSITESCQVKIDVDDNGMVSVASSDESRIKAAISIIESLTQEAVIGKIYKGVVKRIADFGAFVEILPGTDGLVHISQLAEERVNRVTDIVREGDEVWVKVLDVDKQGKIRLSRKDAMAEMGEQ